MTSNLEKPMQTSVKSEKIQKNKEFSIIPIRLRIAVGFVIILIAMGFMTYIYISESQKVEFHLGNINNINSVKQRYAINFRGSVHDRAISLRDVVLANDLREVQIYIDEIDFLTQKYKESSGPLDKLLDSDKQAQQEHVILNDIKKIEQVTLPIIKKVIELRLNGSDEQAHQLLMKKAKPAFTQWLKDINRFIDYEEAKNKEEGTVIRNILISSSNIGLISLVLAVIVAVAAAVWITLALKPLKKISKIMEQMTQGDYNVDVPNYKSHDELGLISSVTRVFQENGLQMKSMQDKQEEMKKRAEEEKRATALKLADDFDSQVSHVIKSLSGSAYSLSTMAEQMNLASKNTLTISNNVSTAAVEANSNVQTVASFAEVLTTSSREINHQVASVANVASQAARDAEVTSISVNKLNDLASNIGEVVGAIKGIAEQTNLLALNATIEAARAGEAGKGFAVVADEVKKLANETAHKTGEIDERVTAIQEAIRNSVNAVEDIISNVKKIDEATGHATRAVEQQNAATDEISRSVAKASTGAQEVSTSIIEVETNASKTKESSQQVLNASQEMGELSQNMQAQVIKFLDTIRKS